MDNRTVDEVRKLIWNGVLRSDQEIYPSVELKSQQVYFQLKHGIVLSSFGVRNILMDG